MPVFRSIISTDTVAEGFIRTFEFKRQSGELAQWDSVAEEMVMVPSSVVTQTTSFLFTTEQVESLRVGPEGTRTDNEILDILTESCLENLKAV